MKNIDAKIKDDAFFILTIKEGKINLIGTAILEFTCQNCKTENKYEINCGGVIPSLFEKEKKCKKCGAEYEPKIRIEIKPYVKYK